MQRFSSASPERADGSAEEGAAAFDELYDRYKDKTWRYFIRQLGEEAARDCQQDLWMKLIENKASYKANNRFGGYLFSIANSVLVDAQRKTMRVVDANSVGAEALTTIPADRSSEPVRASNLQRVLGAVKAALATLPVAQRSAFVLHQESGLSYADIARATDTNTETVKSRLRYARSKLAEELREELRDVEL